MILALAAALALPGCGKISDEEKTDAANLMAGMAASLGNSAERPEPWHQAYCCGSRCNLRRGQ